jgi:two-component system chemotaxis response regulator CheY
MRIRYMKNQLRALIVDDSDLSRFMTGTIIGKAFSYDEAENGIAGVRMYQQAVESGVPYDVVFMDVVMPEMGGKEAVRKIRVYESGAGHEATPIIMISASEMIDDIEGLVHGLMRKPTSRALMNDLLQNIFKGKIDPI